MQIQLDEGDEVYKGVTGVHRYAYFHIYCGTGARNPRFDVADNLCGVAVCRCVRCSHGASAISSQALAGFGLSLEVFYWNCVCCELWLS